MADIDAINLMMCIQAVNAEIKKYEALLTSETLTDRHKIQDFVFAYEKTAEVLKEAYESEWEQSSNLPEYATFGHAKLS